MTQQFNKRNDRDESIYLFESWRRKTKTRRLAIRSLSSSHGVQILFPVQRRETLPFFRRSPRIPPSKCINFRDCAHLLPPPSRPATSDAPSPLPLGSCQFCLRMLFPAGSPFQFRPWPGFPLTRMARGTEARDPSPAPHNA